VNIEYSDEIVRSMLTYYNSFTEKDRRRYAAVEATKLGYGGISYLATLFDCDEKTIKKGLRNGHEITSGSSHNFMSD